MKKKKEKKRVYDTVLGLYKKFLGKYFDEYYDLEQETKEKLGFKLIIGIDYEKLYNGTSDEDYDNFNDYEE